MRPGERAERAGPRPRPRPRPVSDFEETAELPRSLPPRPTPAPTRRPEPAPRPGARPRSRTAVEAERKPEPEPEPEAAEEPEPEREEPVRSRSSSRAGSRAGARKAEAEAKRRRKNRVTAAALVVLVLGVACLVPQVRTILRQSFTHLPQASVAIYFTRDPKIQGTVIDVPITVKGVNSGVSTYGVKVWTENSAGKVDGSTTAKIPTVHGVTAAVVALPVADDAAEVWVSLDGTTQVLHFQI